MSTLDGRTQTAIIKEELLSRRGDWIAMPKLAAMAECYAVHSRVADIRGEGFKVENKVAVCPQSGKRQSYYRIPLPGGQGELF